MKNEQKKKSIKNEKWKKRKGSEKNSTQVTIKERNYRGSNTWSVMDSPGKRLTSRIKRGIQSIGSSEDSFLSLYSFG